MKARHPMSRWHYRCAYCGGWDPMPMPLLSEALCWGCWLRLFYRLPLLPWWKVAP